MNIVFYLAKEADLESIVNIYNWAIENTTATFDTEKKTTASQKLWFGQHSNDYPIVVAKLENKVVAWGSLSRWSDRCAYHKTAELSFYVHPDYHSQGIDQSLLKHLVQRAKEIGLRTLISKITTLSKASIHLHQKIGFEDIGTMKKVGEKFDQILDVHLMQILLE